LNGEWPISASTQHLNFATHNATHKMTPPAATGGEAEDEEHLPVRSTESNG
jgi:hypothetical protein